MSDNALVLEGGGFRAMFTAGVLDVLMEHGIWSFSSVWGVSAGAIAATSYKSHQIGRTMRIMLAYRDDRRLMSLWSFAKTGDIAGSDFLYNEVQGKLDPLDIATFEASPLQMYAVVTDVTFGTAQYLPCAKMPEDIIKVRASSSLPPVSHTVMVDGHRSLDGGTADSIPYEVALGLEGAPKVEGYAPATKALVVLTKHRAYQKTLSPLTYEYIALRSHRYDDFPYYEQALRTRADRYNEKRQRLFELESQPDSPVLVLAPEKPVEVGVSEKDGGKLLNLYLQGRGIVEQRLEEIRTFLA